MGCSSSIAGILIFREKRSERVDQVPEAMCAWCVIKKKPWLVARVTSHKLGTRYQYVTKIFKELLRKHTAKNGTIMKKY